MRGVFEREIEKGVSRFLASHADFACAGTCLRAGERAASAAARAHAQRSCVGFGCGGGFGHGRGLWCGCGCMRSLVSSIVCER
eukprot:2073195-Pleurochrysis_carterae.AAC.1